MFDYINDSMSFISERRAPGFTDVGVTLNKAANFLIIIAFGLSFVAFTFSLIQFIMSRGDPKSMEKPKNAVTWSVGGMVLSLAVFGLKGLLFDLLGLDRNIFF